MSALVASPAPMESARSQSQDETKGNNNNDTTPASPALSSSNSTGSGTGSSGASAATWTPSPNAAPFYPSFTPFLVPGQTQVPQPQPQFYDPNIAAQWAMAYNHMMSQQLQYQPQGQVPVPVAMPVLPFPQQLQQHQHQQFQRPPAPGDNPAFQAFHPYRRPGRQNSNQPGQSDQSSAPTTPTGPPPHGHQPDWRAQPFHPPYARGEASSSQSSLGGSSTSSKHRNRVNSNNSSGNPPSLRGRSGSASAAQDQRHPQQRSSPTPAPASQSNNKSNLGRSSPVPASSSSPRAPHQRVNSNSSDRSSSSAVRVAPVRAASPVPASSTRPSAAPVKPSPLSQGQSLSAVEKRMSRDDSELLVSSSEPAFPPNSGRPGGLKGRLRRAFSMNPNNSLEASSSATNGSSTGAAVNGSAERTKDQPGKAPLADPDAPGAPPKRSRAASLFNPRFNRSTDNISLSSTVSSASVMIRKLGSMGKLARRNTLAGITSIFKDKEKKPGGATTGKATAEASVSLATAEFDRPSASDPDMAGLSPAAQLARAHTLRSNAQEAAERAKTALDRRAANSSASSTSTARSTGASGRHIYEDGRKIIVEDDEEDSGSDTDRGHRSDDDAAPEEDITQRMNNISVEDDDDNDEPWAVGVRRSVERTREPAKGILKNAVNYDQDVYLNNVLNASKPSAAANQRPRSNSYAPVSQQPEPGPFAHMPSPDPDHIDGLHTHKDNGLTQAALPRFSFEFTGEVPMLSSSPDSSPPPSSSGHGKDRESIKDSASGKNIPYQQPTFNSSAPVLSLALGNNNNTAPIPRAATTPPKRISFAPNLSIYDTFSPMMYDRRSEPATCNRLTPALAQRIKEELNSYKMEEMEVHVASRIHTHFFV